MRKQEDIITGYLLGSLSKEELTWIETELTTNLEFAREFEAYKAVWELSENVMPSPEFKPEASWDALHADSKPQSPIVRLSSKWLYRVAAVVLLVLSSIFFIEKISPTRFDSGLVLSNQTGQNLYGFDDGSVVLLDKATELNVHKAFNEATRQVQLTHGTAFFDVATDSVRPFHIYAPLGEIIVKGTSFLVKSENHSTHVAVASGMVDVLLGSQTWTLGAGDQITCTEAGGVIQRNEAGTSKWSALLGDLDNFYDTPLKQIVAYLKQSRSLEVAVPKRIEKQRFTVQVEGLSNAEIIETLSSLTGLSVHQSGEKYSLK